MPAAPAGTAAAAAGGGRGGAGAGSSIIEARRSREAAFYGVDAQEFTDRTTQLVADFVEGALADVRDEFVQALRRRGAGGAAKENDPEAFYDAAVTPCAAALQDAVGRQLDKLADFFELYLQRNIFKVPSAEAAAILEAGLQQDEDAMEVDGGAAGQGAGKAGGKKRASLSEAAAAESAASLGLGLPASAGEVPSLRDEESVDAALSEARVRVRARRRQRKAVEALLGKANADLELTKKEAFALRVQVLQALGINSSSSEDGGATAGSVGEVLEALRAQGQEAAQLMAEADGLIPRLEARQRLAEGAAEEGDEAAAVAAAAAAAAASSSGSKGGSSNGAASLAAEVKRPAIAADMSDIRAAAKEHLRGLANALAPGARI